MSLESGARGEAGQWTIEEPVLGSRQMKKTKSLCLLAPARRLQSRAFVSLLFIRVAEIGGLLFG